MMDVVAYSMGVAITRKAILGGLCVDTGEDLGPPLTDFVRSEHQEIYGHVQPACEGSTRTSLRRTRARMERQLEEANVVGAL